MLIDLGPVVVFVIAFNVLQKIEATKENAIFIATGIFIAATLGAMVYSKLKFGRIAPVLIVTGVLITIFGGLTILLRDQTFIQIKPTITYGFYTLAILGSMAIGQNVWKLMFGHAFNLPDRIWNVLALRWAVFFAFMAALNEIIRNTQTFDFWINTRPFLVFPLILLFAAANTPLVMKHAIEDDSVAPETTKS